ncbi:CYFA0S20e01970g1_1 [Cyberlindnera fabianii]|uniref:CYFA0S20e01970g1_1 n=1 Tax=Cyberlindnera fabianii TaxID=36022 RepID=A0A061B975_CYBFA|nr:Replication factor A protein 3 [Cyberlindnera fabianii]CDR45929.1 CYFA0S20e01970g1_1 [Cyberlindnera fabianii]
MDKPTPRIDGSMLASFPNRTVRLVGRVESFKPGNTVSLYVPSIDNPSTERFDVTYSPDIKFQQGTWFEIIARVTEDLMVRAIDLYKIEQENVSEKALAGFIKFQHAVPELFYTGEDWL